MAFKVEVLAAGETKWAGNALVFATKEEAEKYASDLFSRWMAAKETRVVDAGAGIQVNYKWDTNKGLIKVESVNEGLTWQNVDSDLSVDGTYRAMTPMRVYYVDEIDGKFTAYFFSRRPGADPMPINIGEFDSLTAAMQACHNRFGEATTKAGDYLNTMINFGGEKMNIGALYQWFEKNGLSREACDRWLQGYERSRKDSAGNIIDFKPESVNKFVDGLTEMAAISTQVLKTALIDAMSAAIAAARGQRGKLQQAGTKFHVMSGNQIVGAMLDVCGFANIKYTPGTNRAFNAAYKSIGQGAVYGVPGGRIYCSNGSLSFFMDSINQEFGPDVQYMSIQRAAHEAGLRSLKAAGLLTDAYVESRID